jgi:hypothetical protein
LKFVKGALGILFVIATSMAATMEILGFAEVLLDTIPGFMEEFFFNRQIIGAVVVIGLTVIILVGSKLVCIILVL